MNSFLKKVVSFLLLVTLIFSFSACATKKGGDSTVNSTDSTSGSQDSETSDSQFETDNSSLISSVAGSEKMTICWKDTQSTNAEVFFKATNSTNYSKVDAQLIRKTSENEARVDVLGLKAGDYDFKVKIGDSSKQFKVENAKITEYDRSGYAHFGYSSGVGAYNDDGTLKSGAVVLYVNDANKNTISYGSYVGIGNILTNASEIKVPLAVRFIGRIATRSWDAKDASYTSKGTPCTSLDAWSQNTKNSDTAKGITDLNGLKDYISIDIEKYTVGTSGTEKGSFDYSKYPKGTVITTYDSYFNTLESKGANNVTVEGVGEDAEIFQWGFIWKRANSIEIRNLTFTDNPEDACSFLGDATKPQTYGNYWVHNCVFNAGKNLWDVTGPDQRDKGDGDGSTDITGCHNVTVDYCRYNNCHKTGLIGGNDTNLQYNITFHHNYFNNVAARLPLGRQANMHYYNNYNYKVTSSCMSLRANAYAFSENNYFDSCKSPISVSSGAACKSLNDMFVGCSKGGATVVTARDKTITTNCQYGKTFDTDSSLFYYDAANKKSIVKYMTTALQAKSDCVEFAGVGKINPVG